jgi:hypothetical protein
MEKFIVLDVTGLTPFELDKRMNELDKEGYKRVFQSDILWYQGKGEWGIVTFELKDSFFPTPQDLTSICLKCGIDLGICGCHK